eukprot:2928851-Pyramimonas_sp.AAC.1
MLGCLDYVLKTIHSSCDSDANDLVLSSSKCSFDMLFLLQVHPRGEHFGHESGQVFCGTGRE